MMTVFKSSNTKTPLPGGSVTTNALENSLQLTPQSLTKTPFPAQRPEHRNLELAWQLNPNY